ncbi:MAG: hypothetical protein Q8S24_02385 [Eubacteriales bacterium]|nr:hypothetical protein [Eubacteriales bacterium]
MDKFPFYDRFLKSWIYDKVPASMILATDEKVLKMGTKILFKPISTLRGNGQLENHFISAVINAENIKAAKHYLKNGLVYIKKTGV